MKLTEIILKVLKENDNYKKFNNTEIATNIIQGYKELKNYSLTSMRKRVGEVRKQNKLLMENDTSNLPNKKIKIKETNIELDKNEWLQKEKEKRKDKTQIDHLKETNDHLMKELETSERKLEMLLDIQASNQRKEYQITPDLKEKDSEAVSCMILSDVHIEEQVDPTNVNYLNEYNVDIARNSVFNFFKNGVKLHNMCNKDVNIKNIILGLLGDGISNYIHEELMESNYLSPTQAILEYLNITSSGIKFLLENTDCNLKIVCKYGNHPRTSEKIKYSTGYKNNYEWMMYHILKREFNNEKRVEFIIDNSYLTYVDVFNYTLRFHHGNAIKYEGGVGGITVPMNKAISQWDKQRKAYLDVIGHFHQLKLDTGSDKFIINGSVIGYSAYSIEKKFAFEDPKQAFFLIDKKRGKTFSAPIFVR